MDKPKRGWFYLQALPPYSLIPLGYFNQILEMIALLPQHQAQISCTFGFVGVISFHIYRKINMTSDLFKFTDCLKVISTIVTNVHYYLFPDFIGNQEFIVLSTVVNDHSYHAGGQVQ
jgi:hypothetical protein